MKFSHFLPAIILFAVFEILIWSLPWPLLFMGRQILLTASNAFFALFLVLGLWWLGKNRAARPQTFVTNFMAFTGLKMFASLIFLLVLGINFRSSLTVFFIGSLVFYLGYTFIEVLIFRRMAKQSEEN